MTVITIGNLRNFNFLFVDTLVSEMNENQKLVRICDTNKIRYLYEPNFIFTGCGPAEIFSLVDGYITNNQVNLLDRNIRETIVAHINANIHNFDRSNYQPNDLTVCFISRNGVGYWKIVHICNDLYDLLDDDFTLLKLNEIKVLWYGHDIQPTGIDLTTLNIDNIYDKVSERMKIIDKENKIILAQVLLPDLTNFSHGIIRKPTGNTILSVFYD